jgi:O-methyltransferase
MVEPSESDVSRNGVTAEEYERTVGHDWATASLEQVQAALRLVPYPASKIHFVKGRVEDTIPESAPDHIELLRLDTDWYESTKHELVHLYPRLARGRRPHHRRLRLLARSRKPRPMSSSGDSVSPVPHSHR